MNKEKNKTVNRSCYSSYSCYNFDKDNIFKQNLSESPNIITYESYETIKIGNYDIKQSGWEWGDGNLIKNKCPDYVYMETSDGAEFPLDRERAGLVTLSVTKAKSDTTTLDITNIAFEICNNGTQFDMELFYELNPTLEALEIKLNSGEEVLLCDTVYNE